MPADPDSQPVEPSPWFRLPHPDRWGHHIHSIAIGDPKALPDDPTSTLNS